MQLTVTSTTVSGSNLNVTVNGSFTDPGNESHGVDINWGDGTTHSKVALASGVHTFSATHQYLGTTNPPDTITATVLKGEAADFLTTGQTPDALVTYQPIGATTYTLQKYSTTTGAFDGNLLSTTSFLSDVGVIIGPDGNVYAAGPNSVLRFDALTGAGLPSAGNSGANFTAPGSLGNEDSLAFGPDGNLYVANNANNSILRFNGTTGAAFPRRDSPGRSSFPRAQAGLSARTTMCSAGTATST